MKLTVMERLSLLGMLPNEGSFHNLKLIRVARENLSFNDKENKALKFKQVGEQITWDQEAAIEKEVKLGEMAVDIIKKSLQKLDKEEKLHEQHFSLYEKFVDESFEKT